MGRHIITRGLRVAIVLGTRPEIIKMSPVIKTLEKKGMKYFILHTGQHYSYSMDRVFFKQLKLPEPKYNLNIGSGTPAEETSRALMGVEKVLVKEDPDLVLVEGDTNSVLAAALAASKLHIRVGHIEAGLRSGDMSMPEEINRLLTDHASDYLFAPTAIAKTNLIREGLEESKIQVTGNTVVDALQQNLKLAEESDILSRLRLDEGSYFLATLHRQENVDNPTRLKRLMEGLGLLHRRFKRTIVFPIHPRTRKRLHQHAMRVDKGVLLTKPVDYLSFLKLESKAELILTDSGGVQEEACILRVPCVTLRDNTERPETLQVGANILAGSDPKLIVERASIMIKVRREWENPFGDGRAAERIVKIIVSKT